MELKDVIKSARIKKNLKQEDVSSFVKVTVQTYRKWEAGKTEPKASQVGKLSEILGISTDAICNGRENKKLELMDFVSIASSLSQGLNGFEIQMAIWESFEDDKKYLDTLNLYSKDKLKIPADIRYQNLLDEIEIEKEENNIKLDYLKFEEKSI